MAELMYWYVRAYFYAHNGTDIICADWNIVSQWIDEQRVADDFWWIVIETVDAEQARRRKMPICQN